MPKLLEQVRTVIRTRHYSLRTEDSYINWIKRFVIFNGKREESNLAQNIFLLRRALGDHRSAPTYIETVTRRGYRFIGSVTKVSCVSSIGVETAR